MSGYDSEVTNFPEGRDELPVGQASDFSNHLDPPGDLRFRQPEHLHLHLTTSARRPDGVQGAHGG